MKEKKSVPQYTEVLNDTVVLRELLMSCLISIILTMSFFLLGKYYFNSLDGIDPGMADGFALLFGLIGCVMSIIFNSFLYKPKRRFDGQLKSDNIEHILEMANMTLEEEIEAIRDADEEIIKELEDLEMYSLLALIPKDSKNYKEEYQEKAL